MLVSLKTQPKEGGPNPNINTVMKFDVCLPEKEIYVPSLQCMVNDYMLAGLINPLLGIFLIPINQVINDHKDLFDHDFELLQSNYAKFTDPNYKENEEKIIKEHEIILREEISWKKIESEIVLKKINQEVTPKKIESQISLKKLESKKLDDRNSVIKDGISVIKDTNFKEALIPVKNIKDEKEAEKNLKEKNIPPEKSSKNCIIYNNINHKAVYFKIYLNLLTKIIFRCNI